jgi:hypothetical protein
MESRMTMYVAYTAETLTFDASPVTFDAASGVTTLVGGAAEVSAKTAAGASVTGTATIIDADTIRCTFAANSFTVGRAKIQVRATPLGFAEQTVLESIWDIRLSV